MLYHHIQVKINTKKNAPYFTGSMIRGSLGHALKSTTCINPSFKCEGCFSADSCLYYDFYEKQNIQHKYRLDIELKKNSFDFGFYLFSDACIHLPYLLNSLKTALTENGLGRERETFTDIQIKANGYIVYDDGSFDNKLDIEPQTIHTDCNSSKIKISLVTPLRIKKSNQLEYEKIQIEHILRSIYQRKKLIFDNEEVYSLDYKPNYLAAVKTFEYKPLYRKSDRQDRKIIMDGVLGEMAIIGLDKKSCNLLKIGEFIGAGKQTVFGMGKIKVEELNE